jgi:hypothetical protein
MTCEIPLTRGYVALVDEEDYERLFTCSWFAHVTHGGLKVYASGRPPARGVRRQVLMHRFIVGLDTCEGHEVDHINGDTLDNRRGNLRLCSRRQNGANMQPRAGKRFKGAWYLARTDRWGSQIKVNYKRLHLGYFATEEEAARAYDQAALEHFGEFARLNFPQEAS